jgi:hypothetical protein
MLSTGLWRQYINVTITILDIIDRPVFYLKHSVSAIDSILRNDFWETGKLSSGLTSSGLSSRAQLHTVS